MGERPWFKFYPSDWRADQALRLCSIAARGLWLECLCLMHEAEPYGQLLVNGRPVADAQLAVLTGVGVSELAPLMAELEAAGVFSRDRAGVVYSRRMRRDAKRARAAARYGKLGGNPNLIGPKLLTARRGDDSLKAPAKDQGSPRVQEARIHDSRIQEPESPDASGRIGPDRINDVVAASLRPLTGASSWTAAQKKAAWQSRVCAWAQAELAAADYARFLEAWASGERWAVLKAEEFSMAMKLARERAQT